MWGDRGNSNGFGRHDSRLIIDESIHDEINGIVDGQQDCMPQMSSAFSSPAYSKDAACADPTSGALKVSSCLHPSHATLFKFPNFNRMQAQCWQVLYYGLDNIVLSAPTGAGKTVIFDLAILGMLGRSDSATGAAWKALYLAPLKSLCSERVQDWTERFKPLGYGVMELTGDSAEDRKGNFDDGMKSARIIVATPEMWEAFVRKARNPEIVNSVTLVCIDEVHMLNMQHRGATLEGAVARFHARFRNERSQGMLVQDPLRFVAVSATVPNISDIGQWLNAKPDHIYVFGPEYRPVPLRVVVRPCGSRTNEYIFQESLNSQLPALIREFSGGRATLVFCATKRACETAAKALLQDWDFSQLNEAKREILQRHACQSISDGSLKHLVARGVAIHHAGLSPSDRRIVSDLFLQEALMVIFCTQTLALGVNLPARLVIVKGTTMYKDQGWVEYDSLEMTQIIGRAGRPQFDTEGTAVILADYQFADKWKQQVLGNHPIESHFADGLSEALLAEVATGTAQNEALATAWLEGTFLAVRLMQSPQRYASLLACGAQENPLLQSDGPDVGRFLGCLCKQQLCQLLEAELIQEGRDGALAATALGRTVCKLSVQAATVAKLIQAERPQNLQEVFELLCTLPDFEEFRPNHGEKAQLRELAKKSIRWAFKSPVDTSTKKTSVLLQFMLSDPPREKLPWDLHMQQMRISKKAMVLMRLLVEFFKGQQQGRLLADALVLEKCLKKKLWHDSPMQSRQLSNIGDAGAQKLLGAGMGSLEALALGDPRCIELSLGRRPPFGNELQDRVRSIPRINMRLSTGGSQVNIEMIRCVDTSPPQKNAQFAHLVVYGSPTQVLIGHRRINLSQALARIDFEVPADLWGLSAKLIYEDIVGLDMTANLGNVQQATQKTQGIVKNAPKRSTKGSMHQNVSDSAGTLLPKMSADQFASANDQRKVLSAKSTEGESSTSRGGRKRTASDNADTDNRHVTMLAMVKTKQASSAPNVQTMRNVSPRLHEIQHTTESLPSSNFLAHIQHTKDSVPCSTFLADHEGAAEQSVESVARRDEGFPTKNQVKSGEVFSGQHLHPSAGRQLQLLEATPNRADSAAGGPRGLFDGIFDALSFGLSGA